MALRLPKTKGMLRREAASWLARLQSGHDPDIERKFQRWRDADPRHADAFDRVRRSYDQAGLLRHSQFVGSVEQEVAVPRPKAQPRPALAAAAVVAIVVSAGVLAVRGGVLPLGSTDAVMLMTTVGEIRQVSLADGSKVTLDTSTKVDVEIGRSHRKAHLRYGRARFQIVQGDEPFVVETDNTTISTRQGVIDVEQLGPQRRVEVIAGAADVRGATQPPNSPVALGAGQNMTVDSTGETRTGAAVPAHDWTSGMLQFDGTPLLEAVALANRYSDRHIIVVGDLTSLRVTGAFRAGDTTGLAKALAAAFGLTLQHDRDGNPVLSQRHSSKQQNKRGG